MNTNEDLRARLLAAADEAMDCGLETDDSSLLREAAAALARQEEGREACECGPKQGCTKPCDREHARDVENAKDVIYGIVSGINAFDPKDDAQRIEALAAYRKLTHPAPPSAGEGDAEELAQWLEAKYRRHGEDEDRRAAALIRRLAAPAPHSGGDRDGYVVVGWQRRWRPECVPKRGVYMERDWGDIPETLYNTEPDRFEYRHVYARTEALS